jgi:IS5 family transposase
MLEKTNKQKNFFDEYLWSHLIPDDHILVKIKESIDFSFVEEETKDLYSPDFGRPAYPPEVLFRMLFLEFYYNLSDVEVSKQCQYNVLYRWFIGLKIEDRVPDDTSLVVFRRRLGEERFETIFNRIVECAKSEGLLKERYKMVDATAIIADVAIPNTVNLLRQGRRVILKDISNRDPLEAKRLEPEYSCREKLSQKPTKEELFEEVEKSRSFIEGIKGQYGESVDKKVEALERILNPNKDGEKVVSFVDMEARHGKKSKKRMFSGYKAHIAEDESEIITSCDVLSGNRNEGSDLTNILEQEKEKGIKAKAVVADGLYDSGENRKEIHNQEMKAYIPFRRERKWMERFKYDPETDQVICDKGRRSIGKFRNKTGLLYYFSARDCRRCSNFRRCVRENQKRMTIWVSDNYKHKIMDDGEGRSEALGLRKMIERKFGEAKKWHGMERARFRGKERVKIQVLMTFMVINIKRITRLMEENGQMYKLKSVSLTPI